MKNRNKYIEAERSIYLDSVGGLLLLNMMLGHCMYFAGVWDEYSHIMNWLNFFMPWFFYKNGIFFKYYPFGALLRKDFKRLLKPYIYYGLAGLLIYMAFKANTDGYKSIIHVFIRQIRSFIFAEAPQGNQALWFLISLFICRQIYNNLTHFHKWGRKILLFISIITACTIYYIQNNVNYSIPSWILNIPPALAFFSIGNIFKEKILPPYITILICFVYIVWFYFAPVVVGMHFNKLRIGFYPLWFIQSTIGILSINNLFSIILNYKNIFSVIGKDTMPLYCVHWIFLIIIQWILFYIEIKNHNLVLWIYVGGLTIFLIFFIKTRDICLSNHRKINSFETNYSRIGFSRK